MNKFVSVALSALLVAQICYCAPASSTSEPQTNQDEKPHQVPLIHQVLLSNQEPHGNKPSLDNQASLSQQSSLTNQHLKRNQVALDNQASPSHQAALTNQESVRRQAGLASQTSPSNQGSVSQRRPQNDQASQNNQAALTQQAHGQNRYLPKSTASLPSTNAQRAQPKPDDAGHPVYVVNPSNVQEPVLSARPSSSTQKPADSH